MVVRDDDTSCLTSRLELETVYAPLWEKGLPVCLSVIPAHYSDIKLEYYEQKFDYDPNITPIYQGIPQHHFILDNSELSTYLDALVRQGVVEVVLHGFSHKYHEFAIEDPNKLETFLDAGSSMLRLALPEVTATTFIAPYDYLSAKATEIVLGKGYDLCTSFRTLKSNGSFIGIGEKNRLDLVVGDRLCSLLRSGNQLVYTSDQYFFNDTNSPDDCLKKASEALNQAIKTASPFIICANHYWEFSRHHQGLGAILLGKWHQFMSEVLATPEVCIVRFSDLKSKFCAEYGESLQAFSS